MLTSIIINNFNYGRYLHSCVESALAQTHPQTEVIVVDDGSTDNSAEVIRSFGDKIKSLLKANGGQASAMNEGFKISKGEAVLFLDSDDILHPDAIARSLAIMGGKLSKVHFPLEIIDENGQKTGGLLPPERLSEGSVVDTLLQRGGYSSASTSGNLFSRRFLAEVMPIPERSWSAHADSYLIHAAPFFGDVGAVHAALGQYRVHSSCLSLSSLLLHGEISPQKLRFEVVRDIQKRELIEGLAAAQKKKLAPETILNGHGHYKMRLASLCTDPKRHPYPEDRVLPVVITLVQKCWIAKELEWRTRLAASVWAVAVGLLPRKLSQKLIIYGISPKNRSSQLARLAGTSRNNEPSGSPNRRDQES